MQTMRVIDSDAHVDETEDTWSFMPPEDEEMKPTTVWPKSLDPNRRPTRYWMIDGHRKLRRVRDDKHSGTSVEQRELMNVQMRLDHMDQLGIDTQVIFPTLFLVEPTHRPEVELSLTRSYNRWMADRCAPGNGRLRWVCVLPMNNMDQALEELHFAKDHGACGVLKKGNHEAGHLLGDPYFYPLYEDAERLNMPLCFHTGSGVAIPTSREDPGQFLRMKAPVLNAAQSIIQDGISTKFPALRYAIVEAGASWAPMVEYTIRRDADRAGQLAAKRQASAAYDVRHDVFKANNIYVTCQVDEDLPMLLKYVGEDNLLMGTDYSHEDQSQEHTFLRMLQARVDHGDVPQSVVQKIVHDNPKACYGV